MGWISLFLQLLSFRRSFQESSSVVEALHGAAEKAKRFSIALVGFLFGALFLLSSFFLAVIELGLQIDRGIFPAFSGLMISASILGFVGIVLVLFAAFYLSQETVTKEPPKPPRSEDRVKQALEEFAIVFIQRLSRGLDPEKTKKESERG
jgi:hypothetical protein